MNAPAWRPGQLNRAKPVALDLILRGTAGRVLVPVAIALSTFQAA